MGAGAQWEQIWEQKRRVLVIKNMLPTAVRNMAVMGIFKQGLRYTSTNHFPWFWSARY